MELAPTQSKLSVAQKKVDLYDRLEEVAEKQVEISELTAKMEEVEARLKEVEDMSLFRLHRAPPKPPRPTGSLTSRYCTSELRGLQISLVKRNKLTH